MSPGERGYRPNLLWHLAMERNDAEAETPVLWPPHAKSWLIGKDWCWEGLGAAGEGDDRGWDGWMASLTRWTWVWVNSGSWSWTGRPGMLQFMGLQRVGHNWVTELNWKLAFDLVFCCLVTESCQTVCDPMNCRTPGFPVLHYLLEFSQTHVYWVNNAI